MNSGEHLTDLCRISSCLSRIVCNALSYVEYTIICLQKIVKLHAFCIFRSPFTITEALLICSTMVFLSGLFSSPLFFSAGITTIISFDNFSSHSNGLTLNDFQICQPWSPDTVLREFRTKYQVVTCFLQFILPLISVVCTF